VSCSGASCEEPACSARASRDNEPGWNTPAREQFKVALASALRQALLEHYRAVLLRENDLSLPGSDGCEEDAGRPLELLLETELRPLVAKADDSKDCRRAYAEVVASLVDEASSLRKSAEKLLLQDLDRHRVPRRSGEAAHTLDGEDLRSYWHKVDDTLEEAWVGHGFAVAKRLERERRSREAE